MPARRSRAKRPVLYKCRAAYHTKLSESMDRELQACLQQMTPEGRVAMLVRAVFHNHIRVEQWRRYLDTAKPTPWTRQMLMLYLRQRRAAREFMKKGK